MKKILFCLLILLTPFLLITSIAYAEKDEYGRDLPEKMVVQKIAIEQLHKDYKEKNHRYKLTIVGERLKDRGNGVLADWEATCGRFYSKYNGVLNAEEPVIWGYEFPKENCEEAIITVSIKDYLRNDSAKIKQKVFFPEEAPSVDIYYTKHLAPSELWKKDFFRWIKVKIGKFWSDLKPHNDNAKTFEVPKSKGGVRG